MVGLQWFHDTKNDDAGSDYAVKQIIKAGKLLEKQGAQIMGLGAYTSVVKDAGISIAKALDIGVTTVTVIQLTLLGKHYFWQLKK